jgi:hypothetical protein
VIQFEKFDFWRWFIFFILIVGVSVLKLSLERRRLWQMHAHRWTVKNKGQAKPNFMFNHKCMKYGLLDSYKINVHNQSPFFSVKTHES